MHNLEVFAAEVCNKKTLKDNNLTELRKDIHFEDFKMKDIKTKSVNVKSRKQKSVFEKIPPTYGAFHQHIKCAHLHSLYL